MTEPRSLSEEIPRAGLSLIAEAGLARLTFDALAARLGVSKQAVLYWYPGRAQLLAAMAGLLVAEEADAVLAALDRPGPPAMRLAAALRALAEHHLRALDRFRLTYMSGQTGSGWREKLPPEQLSARIHPQTDRMYGGLEAAFREAGAAEPRRAAFAAHAAVIGLVTMFGLADSQDDPLKHGAEPAIATLIGGLLDGLAPGHRDAG